MIEPADTGLMPLAVALALSPGNKACALPGETLIVVSRIYRWRAASVEYKDIAAGVGTTRIWPIQMADVPRAPIWLPIEQWTAQMAQAANETLRAGEAREQEGERTMPTTESLVTPPHPTLLAAVGDQVLYVLPGGRSQGESRPAFVVRSWNGEMLNLQVLTDGTNDFLPGTPGSEGTLWATSVHYDPEKRPGFWYWGTPFGATSPVQSEQVPV